MVMPVKYKGILIIIFDICTRCQYIHLLTKIVNAKYYYWYYSNAASNRERKII